MTTATTEQTYLVLTAVGPDRPGLVSEVAQVIMAARANVEDSRMAILGGEFALLLLVSASEAQARALEAEVPRAGQRLGLNAFTKRTTRAKPRDFLPYHIRVTGVDHPGIVLRVSELLARREVNVASLESRLSYAPLSGTPMFVLEAELQVPSEVALAELRRELVRECEDENLDLVFESARRV